MMQMPPMVSSEQAISGPKSPPASVCVIDPGQTAVASGMSMPLDLSVLSSAMIPRQ